MRKVKYARLQSTDAFVPGIGGLGPRLPIENKTFQKFEMDTDNRVLLVRFVQRNVLTEALIPLTNVQILVLENEENPPTSNNKNEDKPTSSKLK
jgi:hypothetical protein